MRLRVGRLKGERPAVAGGRLVQPAAFAERGALVGMVRRDVRIDRDRLADHVRGEVLPAGLQGNHTQQVQGVGMAGIDRQNLLVKPFGLP